MDGRPPYAPENAKAYKQELSDNGRIKILIKDFREQPAAISFLEVADDHQPVEDWTPFPTARHSSTYAPLRGTDLTVDNNNLKLNPYLASAALRRLRIVLPILKRWVVSAALVFLAFSVPEIVVVQFVTWLRVDIFTGGTNYFEFLAVISRSRFDQHGDLIPGLVLNSHYFSFASAIAFSPAFLVSALVVGLLHPRRDLGRVCVYTAVPVAVFCLWTGVGLIYWVRLWSLVLALVCVVAAICSAVRSRSYLSRRLQVSTLYNREYHPAIRSHVRGARKEQKQAKKDHALAVEASKRNAQQEHAADEAFRDNFYKLHGCYNYPKHDWTAPGLSDYERYKWFLHSNATGAQSYHYRNRVNSKYQPGNKWYDGGVATTYPGGLTTPELIAEYVRDAKALMANLPTQRPSSDTGRYDGSTSFNPVRDFKDDPDAFIEAEQRRNHRLGSFALSDPFRTTGQVGFTAQFSLAELLDEYRTTGKRLIEPQHLADAAGISLEEAKVVLSANMPVGKHYSRDVERLFELFHS